MRPLEVHRDGETMSVGGRQFCARHRTSCDGPLSQRLTTKWRRRSVAVEPLESTHYYGQAFP